MTRTTSTVLWSILGAAALVLLTLALLYGPGLYREGQSMVGPFAELVRSDKTIETLAAEFPYQPPADGLVDEERLLAFLEIRRELLPHYERWMEIEKRVERKGEEDEWGSVKEVIGATRDVFRAQTDLLRGRGMSPAEFRWLEERVYDEWLAEVEKNAAGTDPAAVGHLRAITAEDLRFAEGLSRRHGNSRALTEMEERLRDRLRRLENPERPEVAGTPEANAGLFWKHREAISSLKLEEHMAMHSRLRESELKNLQIHIGDQGVSAEGKE